jgi:NAD(P)-dependent dehydrogenase (short-subunit alcohol dehydrogenase family)
VSEQIQFDGGVVVVTGGGRGMGRAHALALAERGARVVVNDLGGDSVGHGSDPGPAQAVVDEIEARGGDAFANTDSVATSDGCEALIAAAAEHFGRIDAVIHNAGIVTFVPINEMEDELLIPVVEVHLLAAVRLTRAVWPHFVVQGGGRLLYISSAAGLFGSPGLSHYGPAKAALASLARIVSIEGAPVGVQANTLAVFALTRILESAIGDDHERLEWTRRYMRPELTSAAAVWLVHPDCPASGETYHALGGRVARIFIGETVGHTDLSVTPEGVRDQFEKIRNTGDWYEPMSDAQMHEATGRWLEEAGADPRPKRDGE